MELNGGGIKPGRSRLSEADIVTIERENESEIENESGVGE